MVITKTNLIVFLVGVFLGLATGFFTGKAIYDRPTETKIERDTVVVTDTVKHYLPTPKDSIRTKYITRYLPVVDTAYQFIEVNNMVHDTVAVAVPITSKHYNAPEYDAWVSGFEPNLDSISIYNKTEYITTTITRTKPPDKWELDVVGGIDYNTTQKNYTPYAIGQLMYKPNRLQVGVQGGVVRNGEKAEPIIGGVVKIRIF